MRAAAVLPPQAAEIVAPGMASHGGGADGCATIGFDGIVSELCDRGGGTV